MKKVIFAGNAVTANILYGYLKRDSRYQVVASAVDDAFLESGGIEALPTIGLSHLLSAFPPIDAVVIMAMGYGDLNRSRASMFTRLKEMGYAIETYVHPHAGVYTQEPLGEGCVVLPSAVIEPHARIGANTMIWCNVTLAHDCRIGENCWIAAGTVVSGQAQVMRNTFLGVNATVVNKVTVGEYNIVGATALISKDTKPNTVHLARSAEPLRYTSEDYVKYFGV